MRQAAQTRRTSAAVPSVEASNFDVDLQAQSPTEDSMPENGIDVDENLFQKGKWKQNRSSDSNKSTNVTLMKDDPWNENDMVEKLEFSDDDWDNDEYSDPKGRNAESNGTSYKQPAISNTKKVKSKKSRTQMKKRPNSIKSKRA